MQYVLVPHPTTPPRQPAFEVWARVDVGVCAGMASTTFVYGVSAPAARFLVPAAATPKRADNLWQTTCFEAFVRDPADGSYREWNSAPSGDWAAYDFAGYRQVMKNAAVAQAPRIITQDHRKWWMVSATISAALSSNAQLALSAVLQEPDGNLTYWALAHPFAGKPDFHHPGSFRQSG